MLPWPAFVCSPQCRTTLDIILSEQLSRMSFMGSLPSVLEHSVADVLRVLLGREHLESEKTLNRATSFMCRALDHGDW